MIDSESNESAELTAAWTPDLFGPIFKKESITLREALIMHNSDKRTRIKTTFVPDELIHTVDLNIKTFREFRAILMLVDTSGIFALCRKFANAENNGSYALINTLNMYTSIIIKEIYSKDGDVIQYSANGLLAMWKIRRHETVSEILHTVVLCAQRIKESMLKEEELLSKTSIVISAGEVTFSLIGNDFARSFVIAGSPMTDLKNARKVCLPTDLVLSLSAWEHCTPSHYEYVIKDSSNIKIVKVLENVASIESEIDIFDEIEDVHTNLSIVHKASIISGTNLISIEEDFQSQRLFAGRLSATEAIRRKLGSLLNSYIAKPVIQQIEKNSPLEFLTETRRLTTIFLNVASDKRSNRDSICLIDQCFYILHSIIDKYDGSVTMVNLYEKDVIFLITFGLRGYLQTEDDMQNVCRNGITCAKQMLHSVKELVGVQSVSVGVSTGMTFCGVIGHAVRRQYMTIGTTVEKAMRMMNISFDKVTCDYDTVLYSHLPKIQFRPRGVKYLKGIGKLHVYEFVAVSSKLARNETPYLEYCYPILGRFHDLECFGSILDDIGVIDRQYCGLLIEGHERSGKSRLLDAFVTIVLERQIKPIRLSLHCSFVDKPYAVIYHVVLMILETENCQTIDERERALLSKLTNFLQPEDFCYLNAMMRVRFPLSKEYCSDTDWKRHAKTKRIFQRILNLSNRKICILLDDIQYMDLTSWRFLSLALDNSNVVIAMTILKSSSWKDLSKVETNVYRDIRIMKRSLYGLDSNLLSALACQFLNVLAIPTTLDRALRKHSENKIAWCEAFLTLILISDGLDFLNLSLEEVKEYDLVFPDSTLITKVPANFMPEDLAPPIPWTQIHSLNVCVTNEKYVGFADAHRDVIGLRKKIYERMSPYEQNFIKCAATLGTIFRRTVVQNVLINSTPLYTAKTIAKMIRTRILECGSIQRRSYYTENLTFCVFKKRQTFSDMHHLVTCGCRFSNTFRTESLAPYAHCKMLEFKVPSFCKLMYNTLSKIEKSEHHGRAVNVYQQDARKCTACGGGNFLRAPSKEPYVKVHHKERLYTSAFVRKPSESQSERFVERKYSVRNGEAKRRESVAQQRISILPSILDDDDDDGDISLAREGLLYDISRTKLLRRSVVIEEAVMDPSCTVQLREFSYIDSRNCQCNSVMGCLFWKLHQHIKHCEETEKLLSFLIEYGAGLIETAQPNYAIKILTVAKEKNEAEKSQSTITNKGIILSLTGDAFMALGNYSQAKKFYVEAVMLYSVPPETDAAICYNTVTEKLRQTLEGGFPNYFFNRTSGRSAMLKLELASYLRRFASILVIEGKYKSAKLIMLKSLRAGFESAGSFLVKGEIYLTATRVFRDLGNLDLVNRLEKPMMSLIQTKNCWVNAEEMFLVAEVFRTIYRVRALRGEYEGAIEMGFKVLRMSGGLHISRMKLDVLPCLIEIQVWTKRTHAAVDLMQELYSLSNEDIDKSAMTWYYALCLELLLDAGIILEPFEKCLHYSRSVTDCKTKACVLRDPESYSRLLTCIWIWQLRMGFIVTEIFAQSDEFIASNVKCDEFSRILTCSKRLECYLLLLLRCINMKKSTELNELVERVYALVKALQQVSNAAKFIKPWLHLLESYFDVIRGRRTASQINLHKAQKWAVSQGNKLMTAWVKQNKRTWKVINYNNMEQYWVEHVSLADAIDWQNIQNFDLDVWSSILYPLPRPDSCL